MQCKDGYLININNTCQLDSLLNLLPSYVNQSAVTSVSCNYICEFCYVAAAAAADASKCAICRNTQEFSETGLCECNSEQEQLVGVKCESINGESKQIAWLKRLNCVLSMVIFVLVLSKVYLPLSAKLLDFSQIVYLSSFINFSNQVQFREYLHIL